MFTGFLAIIEGGYLDLFINSLKTTFRDTDDIKMELQGELVGFWYGNVFFVVTATYPLFILAVIWWYNSKK